MFLRCPISHFGLPGRCDWLHFHLQRSPKVSQHLPVPEFHHHPRSWESHLTTITQLNKGIPRSDHNISSTIHNNKASLKGNHSRWSLKASAAPGGSCLDQWAAHMAYGDGSMSRRTLRTPFWGDMNSEIILYYYTMLIYIKSYYVYIIWYTVYIIYHLVSYYIILFHILSYCHIERYNIILYHITSYQINKLINCIL